MPSNRRKIRIHWSVFLVAIGLVAWAVTDALPRRPKGKPPHANKSALFDALAFARLPTASAELSDRFAWPTPETFRQTHEQSTNATALPLVQGRVVHIESTGVGNSVPTNPTWDDVLNLAASQPATAEVTDCEITALFYPGRIGWRLESVDSPDHCWARASGFPRPTATNENPLVFVLADKLVAFRPNTAVRFDDPQDALWKEWTYSTTLLHLDEPLYEESAQTWNLPVAERKLAEDRSEALAQMLRDAINAKASDALESIRSLLSEPYVYHREIMETAAIFAESKGDLDLALALRRRFLPMGRCSMDTRPQEAARSFADLCFKMGNLPCYLNLQVRIMGDKFDRLAYSNYGEEAHETEASRLLDIGIDPVRFLKGLVVQYAVEGVNREELDTWRLARSISEAHLESELLPFVESIATSAATDEFNRLRATQIWARLIYLQQDQNNRGLANAWVHKHLSSADLTAFARKWLNRAFD